MAQPSYNIVDTGQKKYYNSGTEITAPSEGQSFYGQDAQYTRNAPSYKDNGDGTISDLVTGLMWQQSPDRNGDGIINYSDKLTYYDAVDSAAVFKLAGYSDWRLPTIKELYSLIIYSGAEINPTAASSAGSIPFIDTDYFVAGYGDLSAGDRIIDAQYATSTLYTSTTMGGNKTMFGVNFIDGRIKGYPSDSTDYLGGGQKKYYIRYVRGNTKYGVNEFADNGDGTITDNATGLMWMKDDNGTAVSWESALSYAEGFEYAGQSDWRLPNAKELQSIIDYTRSPAITNSAAIDPVFNCTQITNEAGQTDYPFYWSGTTFCSQTTADGKAAVYVCFGRAMGYMSQYGGWVDVHGAGAQRSDPKVGNPSQYPNGFGPQGDAIRIYNYVRLVRDVDSATDVQNDESSNSIPNDFMLYQNYPNPFNPETTIRYALPASGYTTLKVYDLLGREVITLVDEYKPAGTYYSTFSVLNSALANGVYFYRLQVGSFSETKKFTLLK